MLDWQNRRACNDTGLDFFPDGIQGVIACKAVCRRCWVRRSCLEYALELREFEGIWGGTTGNERKRILRERREVA